MKDINISEIRKEFPILAEGIGGKRLVYLDNAATTQKPLQVLDSIRRTYQEINSNIHRATHYLADRTTAAYEESRDLVRDFLNAKESCEVVVTHGATESINLVANSFGEAFIGEGDEVIVSEMEHHANIVPWQMLCERKRAKVKVLPFDDTGMLQVEQLDALISDRTRLVAVAHMSNALGVVNPIGKVIDIAHRQGVPVLIDGAQGIVHLPVDVQSLDCDFYVFSGHKMYAPTGVGILYGKRKWLEKMPPFMGGGEMVDSVSFSGTTFNDIPLKFEPGTPNYIGLIGLGEAIRYLGRFSSKDIHDYELSLLEYATAKLKGVEGLRIYGDTPEKAGCVSFSVEGIHFFDINTLLDQMGIAVRSGRLCADPTMDHFGVSGVLRASFAFYNTYEEADILYDAILRIKGMF